MIRRRMEAIELADPKKDQLAEWTFVYHQFNIRVSVYENPYRIWIFHLPNLWDLSDFNQKLLADVQFQINLDNKLELYSKWFVNNNRSAYCLFIVVD